MSAATVTGTCPSWCDREAGHLQDPHQDPFCWGPESTIMLSLHPPVEYTDETVRPAAAEAYLQQRVDGPLHVSLGIVDGPGIYLTASEARAVAAMLLRLARDVEENTK